MAEEFRSAGKGQFLADETRENLVIPVIRRKLAEKFINEPESVERSRAGYQPRRRTGSVKLMAAVAAGRR